MNPLQWKKEHQVALVLAVVVGTALGVVLGYLVYATGRGAAGGIRWSYWINSPLGYGGLWWGAFGALVGGALVYLKILLSR